MKPVNNKSLLAHIFGTIESVTEDKDFDLERAKQLGNLYKQANSTLRYELERANTILKLEDFRNKTGTTINVRNAESKPLLD